MQANTTGVHRTKCVIHHGHLLYTVTKFHGCVDCATMVWAICSASGSTTGLLGAGLSLFCLTIAASDCSSCLPEPAMESCADIASCGNC